VLTTLKVYVALVLSRPALRSRIAEPVISGLVAVLVIAMPGMARVDLNPTEYATLLRISSTVLALGAAFLLNDPVAGTTAVAPVSRLLRHAAALTQGMVVTTVSWAGVLIIARLESGPGLWRAIPPLDVTLEAVTLVTTAVAVAAWLRSVARGRPGIVAGPLLLVITVVIVTLPEQADLFVSPGSSRWAVMHRMWAALWAASGIAIWLASREPVRVQRWKSWKRRRTTRVGAQGAGPARPTGRDEVISG
jgi:hypothetical protein